MRRVQQALTGLNANAGQQQVRLDNPPRHTISGGYTVGGADLDTQALQRPQPDVLYDVAHGMTIRAP
jgi:hypothetical protein